MSGTIVITGASSGIGRATAFALAGAGYKIINLDRQELSAERVTTYTLDLFDRDAVTETIEQVLQSQDIIGLINNAGLARARPLEETSDDLLMQTFDLNLRCAAHCARLVAPTMKRRNFGRIVNIASRSALGRELRTAYAASKGGLIAMTRVWALELGRHGVTSNCVAPGPIATELFDQMNPIGTERRERMIRDIPAGRLGSPEDVANVVRFLLAPESGFVNGQTIYVCGGLSCGVAPL